MAIKALIRIKADKIYEPGSIITGLTAAEEDRLVAIKAAQRIKAPKEEEYVAEMPQKKKRK